MKSLLLWASALFLPLSIFAQTNLITNGSFEDATSPWTGWSTSVTNGNLWAGLGSCGGSTGTDYAWAGDQNESTGMNNLSEDMYQTVTIPSNATAAVLYFDASINTSESGSSVYDEMEIQIQNSSGSFLFSLGTLNNTNGDAGISNCQTWAGYYVNIPSTYWGQTIRIVFVYSTDTSLPTIFRVDDVELLVTNPNCNYSLSANTYNLGDNQAGTFNNVSNVTTSSGCSWNAVVTSSGSWLTTTSAGNGNGSISISVTENTSTSARVGTIEVSGNTLTVNQPALVCEYTISPEFYNCPDYMSATLSNIAIINTSDGCDWDANVLEGSSWLVTNSNGSGSGTINITVLENNSATPRSGSLIVEGETLLIQQPANPWLTGIEEGQKAGFSLFPNPTSSELQLALDAWSDDLYYSITDVSGRTVLSARVSGTLTTIDVSALTNGVYILHLNGTASERSMRFIKAGN